MTRAGIGYDIHRLAEGESLILGGVSIPSPKGTVGHSDADALIHAIIDALLGAAAAGDIGEHFPPTDPAYRGISSRELLKRVLTITEESGWEISNIDSVVILQEPKLQDHRLRMRENIAEDLGIGLDQISVKAKTKEGLDATGELRAVEAHAVALLVRRGDDDRPPPPGEDTVWV